MMRLVLVTETFPPEINGVARTLFRWVEAFRSRGHEVRVIRPRQAGESSGPELAVGVPIPMYPELRFGIGRPRRLRKLFERIRPDLVHIATEGPLGLAALAASRRLGIPVATSFHTNFDQYLDYYRLSFLRPWLLAYLRWFHNRAAVTLVPGLGIQQRLQALGFERVDVWTRGVDPEAFHPRHRDEELRTSLGLKPDDVLLLYVGRLAAEKNLAFLLNAVAELRERKSSDAPAIRLALVGGGPLLTRLRSRALSGLILPGVQTGQALSRWYASGDVFVFPSRSETFGNVIREAMASGLPVVAYDSPGVNEQVKDGLTGLLLPPNVSLTDGLRRICEDAELRGQLGRAAREAAAQHGWEPLFDGLEECYRRLIDAARTEPANVVEPTFMDSSTARHKKSVRT